MSAAKHNVLLTGGEVTISRGSAADLDERVRQAGITEISTPQPPPTQDFFSVDVLLSLDIPDDKVCRQLAERVAFGERKYGTRLKSFNGRNAIVDCKQEVLDGIMYSQQAILEGNDKMKEILSVFISLIQRLNEIG